MMPAYSDRRLRVVTLLIGLLWISSPLGFAQDAASPYRIVITPDPLVAQVGEPTSVEAKVVDEAGVVQEEAQLLFFSRNRSALGVDRRQGELLAYTFGTFTLQVLGVVDGKRVVGTFEVQVPAPPLASLSFVTSPERAYTHTRIRFLVDAIDASGARRTDIIPVLTSSNSDIASVDAFNQVQFKKAGRVTLTAAAEGIRTSMDLMVEDNPVVALELQGGASKARTGDVLTFNALPTNLAGETVPDAPVVYTFQAIPDNPLAPASAGQIDPSGRFVAEVPGLYTIVALSGKASATRTLRVDPRGVRQDIELVGQQSVGVFTSDLWVWEGLDGRDYAVTGTWGANGQAYFWDVTDPATPTMIDTVTVDARTVNDVKVSPDGSLCVITREGASTRRNGLLILDCTNPHEVSIITAYDEHLTGGVHNVYIYDDHIYALSAGQRFDIINIEDPASPHRVGSFELDMPGRSIHDVWVVDGIAYTSNWRNGVVAIDVGNGIKGGSPSNPVKIGSYAYPSGWNHAAFPYHNKETGKFYIIAGDEHFVPPNRTPEGWIHFIDFTDPSNPQEVARYEVPEAGTHNFWVEDDKLYVAYYQGGIRVVDISGDLMGDLYRQGREIAKYETAADDGFLPNKARAWGTMPHKGHIFISDKHSGLWVVKLKSDEKKPENET